VSIAHWRTVNIYCIRHETASQACAQICNKHSMNILLIWTDQYLENALQFKFRTDVELSTCSGGNFKNCRHQWV